MDIKVKELNIKKLEGPVMRIKKNTCPFTLASLETTEFGETALFMIKYNSKHVPFIKLIRL